jgi:hypothetical protein
MHGDSRGPRAVAGRSAWSASDSGRDVALTSATHGRGPVVLWAIVPIRLRLLSSGGAREPRRSNTLLARPLPRSMHQDTATVMPRSSGALPLSPLQANVAEFRPRTLAADELRKRRWRPPLLHESDSLLRAARPAAHWPLGREGEVIRERSRDRAGDRSERLLRANSPRRHPRRGCRPLSRPSPRSDSIKGRLHPFRVLCSLLGPSMN